MQINANLLAEVPKILNPLEIQSARADNEYKQNANQINALKLKEALAEIQARNERAVGLKTFRQNNPQAKPTDYANAGYGAEAKEMQDIYSSDTDMQAKSLKMAHDKAEYFGSMLGALAQDPEPNEQKIGMALRDAVGKGYLSQEDARQAYAEFPRDPAQARQWLRQQELSTMSAKERLPKVGMQDMGGQVMPYSQDLYGNVNTGAPIEKTMSPSDLRQMEEGALNRGVTMRGQDMTFNKPLSSSGKQQLTEIVDPTNPSQMIRIDANTYQGGGVGRAGVIGVSGKEPSAAKKEEKLDAGRQGLEDSLVTLRGIYDGLNKNKAIVNSDNDALTNIGASFGASDAGQYLGGMVGTENQNMRDSINMQRPLLLQAIKEATGMSAKQMDSNAELKLWLATATDPQKGYKANMDALDSIERKYLKQKAISPNAATNKNQLNVGDKQSRYEAWKKAKGLK